MQRTIGLTLIASFLRVCGRDPAPPAVGIAPSAAIVANVAAPAPRHGGTVQVVGNYAVETVAARTGGVAVFWMGLDGTPIPTSQVSLPSVNVAVNGQVRTVPVHVSGGAYVGHLAVPTGAVVGVTIPHVVVYGVPFEAVVVPTVIVVAALPGIIVIPAAPVIMWHGKHRKFRGGFYWR